MFGSLGNNEYFCSVITKMQGTYMITFKITMKKTFLNFLLALLPLAANAEAVLVDNLWYKLDDVDHTAVVVASEGEPYAGAITIDNSISFDNQNYMVVSIGESAFEGCDALTSVSLPLGIEKIEQGAFFGCCWLTSMSIPKGVKKIGLGAFSECTRLTYVIIPGSVTSIGQWAFDKCPSLARIDCEIQEPFEINENVFDTQDATYDVYSMATLVVPDGTKSTYQSTAGWQKFTNIVEASNVGEGGKVGDVFKSGQIYYRIGENNTVSVTSGETKYTGHINIPEQVTFNYITYNVTSVSGYSFQSCEELTSVSVPNGVTNIGIRAFYGCSSLASITIPSSVTQIGSGAFINCNKLASVHITDLAVWCAIDFKDVYANPLMNASLFLNDSKVENAVIPDGATTISNYAFSGYKGLTSVTIPNSVTSIGNNAFRACNGLTTITSKINQPFAIGTEVFSSNDKDIYSTAMLIVPAGKKPTYQDTDGWMKFTNIVEEGQGGNVGQKFVVDGISYKIGENYTASVVAGSTKYTGDVKIPSQVDFIGKTYSVTSIDKSAFENCTGLTSVKIPSSVKSIGSDAFDGTIGLTAVHIPDITSWCKISFADHFSNPLSYAHHLYIDEKEITDLVIPTSVTSIGNYAFYGGSHLKSVDIPNSVTTIGVSAFYGCSALTTITIPESVTSIGEAGENSSFGVFAGCTSLTSILSLNTTPPTSKDGRLINADHDNCVVWVPMGCLKAYKEAAGWKDFKNIKEISNSDVNFDGKLTKADLNVLVAYIMGKNPEEFHEGQANPNGDEKINVADVVKLIDMIAAFGLSMDKQFDFDIVEGNTVISSITCTLNNEREEDIQLTKCELYFNQQVISYKDYSSTSGKLTAGSNISCTFNNLANLASKKGFTICWHYISDGEKYVYRYVLTD